MNPFKQIAAICVEDHTLPLCYNSVTSEQTDMIHFFLDENTIISPS